MILISPKLRFKSMTRRCILSRSRPTSKGCHHLHRLFCQCLLNLYSMWHILRCQNRNNITEYYNQMRLAEIFEEKARRNSAVIIWSQQRRRKHGYKQLISEDKARENCKGCIDKKAKKKCLRRINLIRTYPNSERRHRGWRHDIWSSPIINILDWLCSCRPTHLGPTTRPKESDKPRYATRFLMIFLGDESRWLFAGVDIQ
jgi:hypothetical protein